MGHISQKGPFHYVYIGRVKNDIDGSKCGFCDNGICLKDNLPCMKSSYCKYYNENIVICKTRSENIVKIRVFTLEMSENGVIETIDVYISKVNIDNKFKQISPDTVLAEELYFKKIGCNFKINDTKYVIKNVCDYEYAVTNREN